MSEYRAVLCDHPDCLAAATRALSITDLAVPSVGPMLVPADAEDGASSTLDVCDEHAHGVVVDVYTGTWFWPASEPVPLLRLGLLQGGRAASQEN